MKKWDVFISHASEDKDKLVRELAEKLVNLGVKVWYDEFTLKLGDSLTDSINLGLAQSKFGVIIISPDFLKKKWTDIEYKSLLMKEEKGVKSILPIWHNISAKEVKEYSLYLSEKKSINTSEFSIKKIAHEICEIVRPDIMKALRANLIFNELLKNSKSKTTRISKIKKQTKAQSKLSESQICRAKNIFLGIGKQANFTFEETVDNYELDLYPEREIQVWEMINATYLEFIEKHKITDEHLKHDIYNFLLNFSVGIVPKVSYLNENQLINLSEIWSKNYYNV